MDEGAFTYPKLSYFKSGNPFTGSWKGLNYKLIPEEDTLHIAVWYGAYCSTVSEMAAETDLPLTDDGLTKSRQYLWEQYTLMLNHTGNQLN